MKDNSYRKEYNIDRFARRYYCNHARLNQLRADKKQAARKVRRIQNDIDINWGTDCTLVEENEVHQNEKKYRVFLKGNLRIITCQKSLPSLLLVWNGYFKGRELLR